MAGIIEVLRQRHGRDIADGLAQPPAEWTTVAAGVYDADMGASVLEQLASMSLPVGTAETESK
jgi:hypothetical protein